MLIRFQSAALLLLVACGVDYPSRCRELELGQSADDLPLQSSDTFFYFNSTAVSGPIEDLSCCIRKRAGAATPETCAVSCAAAPFDDAEPFVVRYPYSPPPLRPGEKRAFDEDGVCKIWRSRGRIVARAWIWG